MLARRYPDDWPSGGPIDLSIHDLPHWSSTTEWWYVNAHARAEDGHDYSLFVAFFRQVKGYDPATDEPLYAHSVTWGVSDVEREAFHSVSRVDACAAEEGLKRIRRGLSSKDGRINRALQEILERGNVPTPDRVFDGPVEVALDRLSLQYATDTYRKLDDGSYALHLHDERKQVGCDVTLRPLKPPIRHGEDGVARGSDDETMFYYFIPRCEMTGSITVGGETLAITQGQAWYDHEFGFEEREDVDDAAEAKLSDEARAKVHAERRERAEARQVGWNWLSTQLDDGTDISVYPEVYVHTGKSAGNHCIVSDPAGERSAHEDARLEQGEVWKSTQTFFDYPITWRVEIPSARISLTVKAAYEDQEFITLISKPAFWEGRVEVEGTIDGKAVRGPGFIERSGFAPFEDLEGFFEEVGKVVRKSVRNILPREPTQEQALHLIASEEKPHYMKGVDIQQYARKHLAPIRDIVDRGGKGWRSYAAITCCDIVGGDSREFVQWLALPEMMHVGSLIVDDVQDRSDTRRGGPTAHLIHGEAQAINSGTAAYFLGHDLLKSDNVSETDQLRIYKHYFDALRAGHAGQALDLDGFEDLMGELVEGRGDAALLEERVLAVHMLKTAAPAGCLARIGAVGGSGSDEQVEGLGLFFEDLGLAFQIIDDVLNIRGFKGNLKSRAEDVRQGKITLPVAKAMAVLGAEDRRWLRDTLASLPDDEQVVRAVVDKMESVGAVDACIEQARGLVEGGWKRLDPLVEDSMAKMLLRAFGWFILERHY